MQKQLCLGTITDVYNCIRNSELFRAGDSVQVPLTLRNEEGKGCPYDGYNETVKL